MKIAEFARELSGGDFGDARLNQRAASMAELLGQYPNVSIPAALKSRADIEDAYRFFNNDSITPDRMIAFDATGVPLGIVGQKSWTREEISRASKAEKAEKRRKTPIEEKESYRWIEGLRWAEKAAAACSETTIVCVGDSESDIYDLFAAAITSKQPNLHLLVRAGQNRNTMEDQNWVEQVRSTAKIGDQTVAVRARIAKTSLCHLGRECPEMDCEVMYEPSEWKSVYSVLGKPIPSDGCPSLNDVVRAIARLGGFMNRAKDHPGTQTLWIGLQRSYDLSNAWNTFGPGARKISTD